MAGSAGRLIRQMREQWPAYLALFGVVLLFVQMSDVQVTLRASTERQEAMFAQMNAAGSTDHVRVRRIESKMEDNKETHAAPGMNTPQRDPQMNAPQMGAQSPQMGAQMGGDSQKEAYEWPEPLEEWSLVPESDADVTPLEGEGVVDDRIASIKREGRGVLFNAIHRTPDAKRASKPISEAIVGATRMRAASKEAGSESSLRYTLVTERAPLDFMMNEELCKPMWPECIDFKSKIKVFDIILFYEDFEIPPIIERRERFQTWPELWLKRIMASLHSPFNQTLVVDSDVYGCSTFEKLFDEYLENADVAITLAPAPFGASRNYNGAFRHGFPESYAEYTERNLGLHMLATGRPKVQKLLALFRDVFIRQANDTVHTSIGNDQCAFREAMFSMKTTSGLTEITIPAEIGCRHDAGCADGCYVVHRHNNQEMSRAELKALAKEKNDARKAARAAEAAEVEAAASNEEESNKEDPEDETQNVEELGGDGGDTSEN
eukprot:m.185054 g.185054  ORF g.185054 m.185054 type:complete len:491 (+) comp16324_c0_seq1:80-1552(+)